jgi:hypothetical protein
MAHPLEQLRYVARNWSAGDDLPALDMVGMLADLAEDSPSMLLQACRRMIEYFPASGVAWWLSARALSAPEPVAALWAAGEELAEDPTPGHLPQVVPPGAVPASRAANARRAAQASGPVLVNACAAGPAAILTSVRAGLGVEAAAKAGRPIWAVVARGSLLPAELWDHLLELALPAGGVVVVESGTLESVVGEDGLAEPAVALSRPTCAPIAELRGWKI